MCFTSVVFADVRGTQNRCLCAFRDAFLKQGERKREKPLPPFLALFFSCVSNTLCAWFCLNPRMASNHTLWKLPTSSHPSSWFVFSLLAIDIWEPAETKWCETWRSDRGVYSGSVCVKPCGAMKSPSVPLLALLFQTQPWLGLVLHLQGVCLETGRWMGESPSSQVGWIASFTVITLLKCILIFYSFYERQDTFR